MAKCALCVHRQRDRIEFELSLGHSDREIATRWRVPVSWVTKHRGKHYQLPFPVAPAPVPVAPEAAS